MHDFPTSLQPWPGARSGETFLAEVAGEEVVLRIYGARSSRRGPLAPEVDAAVLELVRGLLPVPEVLEVRRGELEADLPGLLVTSRLPGERLDELLPRLEATQLEVVGRHLGTVVARLGHMVQPRRGVFTDRSLRLSEPPPAVGDLTAWVEAHASGLGAALAEQLLPVAADAQDLLDEDRRSCLVHGGFEVRHLFVDPSTLEVSGVAGWERAHSGLPVADLGHLLRFERSPVFQEAVLTGYRELMPSTPYDLLHRAHAADLLALVALVAGDPSDECAGRARDLLELVARTGNPSAHQRDV